MKNIFYQFWRENVEEWQQYTHLHVSVMKAGDWSRDKNGMRLSPVVQMRWQAHRDSREHSDWYGHGFIVDKVNAADLTAAAAMAGKIVKQVSKQHDSPYCDLLEVIAAFDALKIERVVFDPRVGGYLRPKDVKGADYARYMVNYRLADLQHNPIECVMARSQEEARGVLMKALMEEPGVDTEHRLGVIDAWRKAGCPVSGASCGTQKPDTGLELLKSPKQEQEEKAKALEEVEE